MKLTFSPNIPPDLRPYFNTMFSVCVRELHIEGNDATVHLSTLRNRNPGESGKTNSDIKPGRVIEMHIAPDTADKVIDTFCHEMVHVEQIATGRLYTPRDVTDSGRDPYKTYWLGEYIPKEDVYARKRALFHSRVIMGSDAANDAVPWEAEAYRRGPEIAKIVTSEVERMGGLLS